MKIRKFLIRSVLILCALLLIGLLIFTDSKEQPIGQRLIINIDQKRYPVTGIDISHHTGEVDFQKIKKQNIHFVYMKATEGIDFTDHRFRKNYQNSKKHGVPVGVYHFFRFDRNGKDQAEHFLRKTAGKTFELPMVLDVEEWTNPEDIPDRTVIAEIKNFMQTVKEGTGKTPLIYTNESGYKRYLLNNFPNEQIWICSLKDAPPLFRMIGFSGSIRTKEKWMERKEL